MRYSLINRFRGILIGSLVGEILGGSGCQMGVWSGAALASPKPENAQPDRTLSNWSQIAACGAESLIRCGRLDLEDWMVRCGMMQSSLLLLKATASSSEAALATLPIALFFHDDEVKLRQKLVEAAAVWQEDAEATDGVLVMGCALALALKEKLDVAVLIPRILSYLGTPQTPLVQQLEQVQMLLEQGAGLETAFTQLRRPPQQGGERSSRRDTSIALAFYCFLSTPEDFRLSVSRAFRTGSRFQTTAALTGALSGVYNSIVGIPVGWRLAVNQIGIGVEKLQMADCLLAVWSGFYEVSAAKRCPSLAVAAPHVIQPR